MSLNHPISVSQNLHIYLLLRTMHLVWTITQWEDHHWTSSRSVTIVDMHWLQFWELSVLCLIQFNCTDECPEYAPYTYTMEMEDGDKTALCTAENYHVLEYVMSSSSYLFDLRLAQYAVTKLNQIQQFIDVSSPLWEISCSVGSPSVTCHPAAVTFLNLCRSKLVLDLATLEGCKAEILCDCSLVSLITTKY